MIRRRLPYLDVGAGDEPRLVGQHLVDVVQETQASWRRLQAVQPQRVTAYPQELGRVEAHQVGTVVSRRSLAESKQEKQTRQVDEGEDVIDTHTFSIATSSCTQGWKGLLENTQTPHRNRAKI